LSHIAPLLAALYAAPACSTSPANPDVGALAWNAAGLPLGMMFAARFGDEATLIRSRHSGAATAVAGRKPAISE